jgi:hypothetical protein
MCTGCIKRRGVNCNPIIQTNNNSFFINVERFLYQNLDISGLENYTLIDEQERDLKFPNTYWNSEVSPNNIPTKYNGCTSRIYLPMSTNEYVILLYPMAVKVEGRRFPSILF